jgi:hypothetical protein
MDHKRNLIVLHTLNLKKFSQIHDNRRQRIVDKQTVRVLNMVVVVNDNGSRQEN